MLVSQESSIVASGLVENVLNTFIRLKGYLHEMAG